MGLRDKVCSVAVKKSYLVIHVSWVEKKDAELPIKRETYCGCLFLLRGIVFSILHTYMYS